MEKLKKYIWVLGLGFCTLFVLVQFQISAFYDLVELEYNWLYGEQILPISVPRLETLNVETQIRYVFRKDAKMALAVSQAENGTRACDRVSYTNDIGVFQINAKWHSQRGNLYDCLENIRIAKQIFDEQGNWSAWVAYKNNSYKRFLLN